ncbi:hypothetical protein M0R36_11000 [bacterium]|nr:hypothetical protein [bacterium]
MIHIQTKHSDGLYCEFQEEMYEGYNPKIPNTGEDPDQIIMDFCLECGQVQGDWPGEFDVENFNTKQRSRGKQ